MTVWEPAPVSREEYIRRAGDPDYVRMLAAVPDGGGPNPNLLSFTNSGGLLGKGVCWWHSRFTRNALYLAYFLPESRKPADDQARRIIGTLMSGSAVTAVPGYGDLAGFSRDHRKTIQKTLERRQLIEGILEFAWINGLTGASSVTGQRMERLMGVVHREVSSRGIAYVKFQTPGIDAHALLITGTEALPGGGYTVRYLDSNQPQEAELVHNPGEGYLILRNGSTGVPYLQRSGELKNIKRLVKEFTLP